MSLSDEFARFEWEYCGTISSWYGNGIFIQPSPSGAGGGAADPAGEPSGSTGGSGTSTSSPAGNTVDQGGYTDADGNYIDVHLIDTSHLYIATTYGEIFWKYIGKDVSEWLWDLNGSPNGSWDDIPDAIPSSQTRSFFSKLVFLEEWKFWGNLGSEGVDWLLDNDRPNAPVEPPNTEQPPVEPGEPIAVGSLTLGTGSQAFNIQVVTGSSGADRIVGDGLLVGGGGDDLITGSAWRDMLNGGNGNDTLVGGGGGDLFSGGAGFDAVSYANASTGVVVGLSGGLRSTDDATGDVFHSIEGLIGSAHDDALGGSAEANLIQGGAGNDVLVWSWGSDTLDGGAGNDTVVYDTPYGVTIHLGNNAANAGVAAGHVFWGIENAVGGSAGDALIGNVADNRLAGGAGNDTLTGHWGSDTLDGGSGIDTARYDDTPFGVVVNLSNSSQNGGAAAGDVLIGIENVIGSEGVDRLTGSAAANELDGRFGHDTIDGGLGADVLKGWYGWDTFVFSTGLGGGNVDFLADFYSPDDTIQLSRGLFSGLSSGTLAASAFTIGANATTAQQKIVYSANTGEVFFDADGSGAGSKILFAKLQIGTMLQASDFIVV
jgi:Ca2+-binding RTX toxin-like protein